MGEIVRGPVPGPGRCEYVCFNGMVFTVAIPRGFKEGDDLATQSKLMLEDLDRRLAAAGSDKSRLIEATIFVADMSKKKEFDDAFVAWIPEGCNPSRCCVGAELGGGMLVEIKVSAALLAAK
eukprot:TRINITY_DN8242_c0_g1_i1.p2 TRINITY_DN8242_c0_g1~~TRINITY_DN8242_c0_g1_i1.p2  ORF type:complete len:122 (-),score=50.67 TRINITY_DN8242_c0_g1_i1:176-541(-)